VTLPLAWTCILPTRPSTAPPIGSLPSRPPPFPHPPHSPAKYSPGLVGAFLSLGFTSPLSGSGLIPSPETACGSELWFSSARDRLKLGKTRGNWKMYSRSMSGYRNRAKRVAISRHKKGRNLRGYLARRTISGWKYAAKSSCITCDLYSPSKRSGVELWLRSDGLGAGVDVVDTRSEELESSSGSNLINGVAAPAHASVVSDLK
jgi:hypothetical protein